MDEKRIAQIRRIRRRAAEGGKPSGPGEVIQLCDEILEMHEENRRWDKKWLANLRRDLLRGVNKAGAAVEPELDAVREAVARMHAHHHLRTKFAYCPECHPLAWKQTIAASKARGRSP